jgi:hypothetical protein
LKKTLGYILIIISSFFMICCSDSDKYSMVTVDGVKHYKNGLEPKGNYVPNLRFLFEIKGPENVPDSMCGFGMIEDIASDFNDNIYVLDGSHAVVKKYNRNGDFEFYFPDQKGHEVERLYQPAYAVLLYDTLVIYDPGNRKYVRYLTNGDFIFSQWFSSDMTEDFTVKANSLRSDGRTNLSAFSFSQEISQDDGKYFSNKLCALTMNYKVLTVVKEFRAPTNDGMLFSDLFTAYALKDGLFYIPENTGELYRIFAVDNLRKVRYVIDKEYDKIEYNEFEKVQLNEFLVKYNFPPLENSVKYYKKAVTSIEIDKNNKIWAQPSIYRTVANQDSFYVDIFDGGRFISRTALDVLKPNETYKLMGTRFYAISDDRKTIRVYDYD